MEIWMTMTWEETLRAYKVWFLFATVTLLCQYKFSYSTSASSCLDVVLPKDISRARYGEVV